MRRRQRWLGLCILLTACGQGGPASGPPGTLASDQEFIEVSRSARHGQAAASVVSAGGGEEFYVAIRKDILEKRWFLSAYTKQWFPGDVQYGFADFTLGTRVVSFKQQNDKLFVFDSSDQFQSSDVEAPTVLVEAWPIVDLPSFNELANSEKYVLVDPSAGLNQFGVTSDLFTDPAQGQFGSLPFRVGLAFMQNFRQLADGVTFEEVFNGDIDFGGGSSSAWGTLGMTLRRYGEGDGYVATADPGAPYYFPSDRRLIPGSGDVLEANPVKFNFHPGMKPVEVLVTAGAFRAQADYPDVDLLGAFERGVEGWNDVLGFKALKAVFVHSDDIPDDDKNFVLVDYPGGAPFAFADWRSNPNNGEIRGMSVYFSGAFFGIFPSLGDDPPESALPARAKPAIHSLTWGGMPARRPGCVYWAPEYSQSPPERPVSDAKLTAQEKASRYIQHVVAHEVGHTLGLRHNFAGSLEPPSSSVMDYLDPFTDAPLVPEPGSYDRDAIGYLYGLTEDPPAGHAFCTDEDLAGNATCELFDSGADPLNDTWAPSYVLLESLILDNGVDVGVLDYLYLNELLGFARDTGLVSPEDRVEAIDVAFDRTAVPLGDEDAADPSVVATANLLAEKVLRRIALDDSALRGFMSADLSDPAAIARVAEQAGRMLRNEDGVRTLALRRTSVDVLKRLQSDGAFLELRTSLDALKGELDDGGLAAEEAPFVEDLVNRIQVALTPYFD